MKWNLSRLPWMGALLFIMASGIEVTASTMPSYRLGHPLTWQHQLPVGEKPGWNSDFWFHFELNHANVWNANLEMEIRSTGDRLTYVADFEQTVALFEIGGALNENLAVSVEIPFAHRAGGILDHMIDEFHKVINSSRFQRHLFPEDQNQFQITFNGEEQIASARATGIANIKYKLKYWWLKWLGSKDGSCDCGFSTGVQVKAPVADHSSGLSSGTYDYSMTAHLGIPINKESALYFSTAATHLPENKLLKDWPRRKWHQMYEVSSDIGLWDHIGLMLQFRMESPFMEKDKLRVIDEALDPKVRAENLGATGYNSLVRWRGSQGFGLRYRNKGFQGRLLMLEDWALGNDDSRGDDLYINGAPDVGLVLQLDFSF